MHALGIFKLSASLMPQEKVLNCENSVFNLPVSVRMTVENTVLCVFNVRVFLQ